MHDPRTRFDKAAESYLTSAVHSNQTALDHLVDLVKPKGGTVVDVATGAGHTAYAFAPFVDRMIATDITPNMLRVARETAQKRSLSNFRVAFALAEALPFKSRSLSGLTVRMGTHHFQDVRKFIAETFRALKPGGWFLMVDTSGSEDAEADEQVDRIERIRDPSHVRNYTPSLWIRMIEEAGFAIEHREMNQKTIEAASWLDRMQVSESDRAQLQEWISGADGQLMNYLQPFQKDDALWFHLDEITVLARKR